MARSVDYSRLVQGWMAGCLAATAVLSAFMLVGLATASSGIVAFLVAAIFVAWVPILVFIITGGMTLIPAALVVWISERFRIRSILFFGGVGAVMGGLMAFLRFTKLSQSPELDRLLYVSAGLAAGLAYWFVAGRYAGETRSGGPPPLSPASET
jgi:hypothetical protein